MGNNNHKGIFIVLRPVYKGLFHKISKTKRGDVPLGGHINTPIRTLSLLVKEILLYLLFSLPFFIAHTIHHMRPTAIANMITIPNHMLSHLLFPLRENSFKIIIPHIVSRLIQLMKSIFCGQE
jgi:hypothetical protein